MGTTLAALPNRRLKPTPPYVELIDLIARQDSLGLSRSSPAGWGRRGLGAIR